MPYRRQDDNRGAIGTLQTEAIGVLEENMALAVRCSKELENYIVDCRAPTSVFSTRSEEKIKKDAKRNSEWWKKIRRVSGFSQNNGAFSQKLPPFHAHASSFFSKNAFTLHLWCKWLRYKAFGVKGGRRSAFTLWR